MAKLPPPPQTVPVIRGDGRLSLPWNLWFTAFLRSLQRLVDGLGGYARAHDAMLPLPHAHPTGEASDLTEQKTSGGSSALLARADHAHQKLIQAEENGTDLGSISALNVLSPGLEVDIEPNLTGSLLTDLVGYWPLDETTGSRAMRTGSLTTSLLSGVGGTVGSMTGKFDLAATQVEEGFRGVCLAGTLSPTVDWSSGGTIAMWFYMDTAATAADAFMFCLYTAPWVANGPTHPYVTASRRLGTEYLAGNTRWNGTTGYALIAPPLPYLGPFAQGEWHLLVMWWDAVEELLGMQIDNRPFYDGHAVLDYNNPAGSKVVSAVPTTPLTFDTLAVFNRAPGLPNWSGGVDAVMLWEKTLTAAERERLYVNFRASVSANPHFVTTYGG